jgi:hypothetical protein
MEVRTEPLRGGVGEVLDAAEDVGELLSAVADHRLDLSPLCERWLIAQLDSIEQALARERTEPAVAPLALHGAAA